MKLIRKNKKQGRSPNLRPANRNIPVNNYYRSPRNTTKAINTEDQNKKEQKKRINISKIINFLLVGGAVWLVVFATTLTTTPVIELRKDNVAYYEPAIYEKASKEILGSSLLYRSKILFQETSFEQDLKSRFPEISKVTPLIPLGGRNLSIVIAVSEPFAYVSSGSDTGIVNSEGVLVVKNAKSVPDELLKLRFTEAQSNFEVGSRILTTNEVQLLVLLQNEMLSLEFTDKSNAAIKDVLFNVADGQLEARLKEKSFYIKLSSFADTNVQVGGAKATLKQLDRENKLPSQYIDVRVPGRAFAI
jgi:hypothetical protein